ncbi:unnamed protein product [Musa acuminata subsp. burmannicoides]
MALFLNHPEALQKVHDEIETHVGHQRLVADSDLSNLRYLNSVIKETLRLFPPGPLLVPRESTMECKVGGLHVPRGTMLLVNSFLTQCTYGLRDPEVWATLRGSCPSGSRPRNEKDTSSFPSELEGGGARGKPWPKRPWGWRWRLWCSALSGGELEKRRWISVRARDSPLPWLFPWRLCACLAKP